MQKLDKLLDSLTYRIKKKASFLKSSSCLLPAHRSDSDNGMYIRFVNRALACPRVFRNFKRHPSYNLILEHVNSGLALDYLCHIKANNNISDDLLRTCLINDLIGNPRLHKVQSGADTYLASGTTLRYISVASDIVKFFDTASIASIAEIGAGYGGQAVVLDRIIPNTRFLLLDLAEVNRLIDKYMQNYLLSGSYSTKSINEIHRESEIVDLVISNYAFCELPRPLQHKYIDKVISRSRSGYITMQDVEGRVTSQELARIMNGFVTNEEPLSAPVGFNKLVLWGAIK